MFKEKKTFIDKKDYFRFKDSEKLVHRWVAYKYIYKSNQQKYPLKFSEYQIHYINGNKLNNNISNLKILTLEEPEYKHLSMEILIKKFFRSIFSG